MRTSQKSFFNSGTIVIPAGETREYHCTGQLFICKEASDVFYVSFNDGAFFAMEVGLGFRLADPDEFTKLSFRNDTANALTVEFYAGVGEIRDARLNTVINRLVIVGLKDVSDTAQGYGTVAIPPVCGGAGVTVSGTHPSTGKQRKQIVVQNLESIGNLYVCDAADALMAVIPPGQAWTLQSSATLKLKIDNTAGDIRYALGQTFYTS